MVVHIGGKLRLDSGTAVPDNRPGESAATLFVIERGSTVGTLAVGDRDLSVTLRTVIPVAGWVTHRGCYLREQKKGRQPTWAGIHVHRGQ